MNRYITKRYAAICWIEAVRLATLDGTPFSNIQCNSNVELVHRTDWWAWWSDKRLTTAIGLPEDLCPRGLSADAAALIFQVWSTPLFSPQCGWALLAKVKSIEQREVIDITNLNNDVIISKWEKMTLLFEPNEQGILYCHSYSDASGYRCDMMTERP